ncbi:hypothetical protein DAEQUDRAFT_762928 [Daedalea quercina L-15889]|uniref:Transcription initiation factor TFIID subunit 8 n=1 Tax=Daedalea quercina L-15889 TaxID=1314783 RepID=A0A165SY77_9APHY|nr:hypothetical protein DAEQUDRAFT_762928 [Daedalea quercina L-15889]
MSHYPPQAYSSSQPQHPAYTGQNYYPSQYPSQGTPVAAYPVYPPKAPSPPPEPHTAPEVPAVSSELASHAVGRLVSAELSRAGFDSAEPVALRRLEAEVVAFVEKLYKSAHEYANLANRAGPIAKDVMLASEEWGLETNALHRFAIQARKKRRHGSSMELLPPPSRSPSPELLPSDDEDAVPIVPATLRQLPWNERYLPALPPKHTYLRTPVAIPKKAALPSLEKKLKNAGLVQESLRNLLTATEDNADNEDGELLGHIVNWESTTHPRKRWKLS